jgi:hypothetical protein
VIDARVRRAVADDASALARMRLDFKREDNEDAPTPVSEATFMDAAGPWLRERLENGSWLAWVAEVDGQICGQVFLRAKNFDTLVVWPSERSASLYKRTGFAPPQELLELPLGNDSSDDAADMGAQA